VAFLGFGRPKIGHRNLDGRAQQRARIRPPFDATGIIRHVVKIAHEALPANAPENMLAAAISARCEMGAKFIERICISRATRKCSHA